MNRSVLVPLCAGFVLFSLFSASAMAESARKEQNRVDSIFFNGKIYTMNEKRPIAEAIAIGGGRVIAAGGTEELMSLCGAESKKYDLKGLTVIPGLVDAHAHFNGYALGRSSVDLNGTASFAEVTSMVAVRIGEMAEGEWVKGRGWDQNDWKVSKYPEKEELDKVSADNPVFLVRVCGHAALANSAALELAGIDRNTPDPPGGRVVRSDCGEPSGILIDEAIELVREKIPSPSRDEKKRLYTAAAGECLAAGLTGIHEMGISEETGSIYRELYSEGSLPIRLTVYYLHNEKNLERLLGEGRMRGFADNHFEVAGVKFFIDGSLGARSAALLDDYSDDPGNRGILVMEPDELYRQVLKCHRMGFPAAIHAIGDRGNRIVLDQLEKTRSADGDYEMRDRIEHAQILSPGDIGRFHELGVIPSMQFTHCTSDMPWVEKRLGPDRIKGAYAWRSLVLSGCRIPGGSDFPVESIDPLLGIYAAVTRMDLEGNPAGGWNSGERLNIDEAVKAFTLDAAWAVHQEADRGSLEEGKLADFVILSDDIMNIPHGDIPAIDIIATILGGDIVYRSNSSGF
ncbi:MAG: amidohydrolase [Candidatus Krumholzibacteriota bacterium]|nr:amidohydrolase [Candidatus Krumholzibacteriota bacterium]